MYIFLNELYNAIEQKKIYNRKVKKNTRGV